MTVTGAVSIHTETRNLVTAAVWIVRSALHLKKKKTTSFTRFSRLNLVGLYSRNCSPVKSSVGFFSSKKYSIITQTYDVDFIWFGRHDGIMTGLQNSLPSLPITLNSSDTDSKKCIVFFFYKNPKKHIVYRVLSVHEWNFFLNPPPPPPENWSWTRARNAVTLINVYTEWSYESTIRTRPSLLRYN